MTYSVTPSGSGTSIKQDGVEAISIDASRNVTVAQDLTVDGDVAIGGLQAFQCRAWVNFNGTGTPAIRASGNVSSITDNGGVGDYTINFTNALPDANYAVSGTVNGPAGDGYVMLVTLTTTSLRIITRTASTQGDSTIVTIAIFR